MILQFIGAENLSFEDDKNSLKKEKSPWSWLGYFGCSLVWWKISEIFVGYKVLYKVVCKVLLFENYYNAMFAKRRTLLVKQEVLFRKIYLC